MSIDEDFPFPCAPGFYRSTDTRTNQDGPMCEAICPVGHYCMAGSPEPLPCHTASYCPIGSEYPIPCPKGTYTNLTNLTAADECYPCTPGHWCPLNSTEPLECRDGSYTADIGRNDCDLCPISKYQNLTGQTRCEWCFAGTFCPRGTTIPPCPAGENRTLTTIECVQS